MTTDTRKTWHWAGAVTAGVILLLAVLWFAGVFQATAVQ